MHEYIITVSGLDNGLMGALLIVIYSYSVDVYARIGLASARRSKREEHYATNALFAFRSGLAEELSIQPRLNKLGPS